MAGRRKLSRVSPLSWLALVVVFAAAAHTLLVGGVVGSVVGMVALGVITIQQLFKPRLTDAAEE